MYICQSNQLINTLNNFVSEPPSFERMTHSISLINSIFDHIYSNSSAGEAINEVKKNLGYLNGEYKQNEMGFTRINSLLYYLDIIVIE